MYTLWHHLIMNNAASLPASPVANDNSGKTPESLKSARASVWYAAQMARFGLVAK